MLCAVVVHWGNRELTNRCVQSLRDSDYNDLQIEVVDNDEDNRGFAGGANAGIRTALKNTRVDWVLVLNNDVRLKIDAVRKMVETAEREGVDMVSPTVLTTDGKNVDRLGIVMSKSFLGFNAKRDSDDIFSPSGCTALYSRRLLEDVEINGEYFDEDFFLYGEDSDLGWRARLLGYQFALAGEAIVYHEGSASQARGSLNPIYYGHRNNLLSIAKNASRDVWIRQGAWIVAGQLVSIAVVSWQGHPLLILKAKRDALRQLPRMLKKRREIQARVLTQALPLAREFNPS